MKIRNGFVSNSSSSSYVIAYDKKGVLTDPREIVDFIENHPRRNILFLSDLAEGWDVFILDMHQKNYLLKHKKRFIQYNSDMVEIEDYDSEPDKNGKYPTIKISPVTAYTGIYEFVRDPYEYTTPEVDMSDISDDFHDISIEDVIKVHEGKADEDLIRKYDEAERYYQVKKEREREQLKKMHNDFLDEIKKTVLSKNETKDLEVEYISVDDKSCDPDGNYDYEFACRYFGLDENTYFEEIGDPSLDCESEETNEDPLIEKESLDNEKNDNLGLEDCNDSLMVDPLSVRVYR